MPTDDEEEVKGAAPPGHKVHKALKIAGKEAKSIKVTTTIVKAKPKSSKSAPKKQKTAAPKRRVTPKVIITKRKEAPKVGKKRIAKGKSKDKKKNVKNLKDLSIKEFKQRMEEIA